MQDFLIQYSADPNIKISDLKSGKSFDIDTSSLKSRSNKNNIHAIIDGDKNFHYRFLTIKSKPYIIYYKGNLDILNKPILGIVGPRKMTEYANRVMHKFFESASTYDLVTVSGMAPGVDQLCHSLSIKHKIPTIAVLGGGLKRYLERSNRHIINSIVDHGGLVISEYKLDFQPTNYSFPQRNRIIAGLCDSLFLPEAGEDSGSLITVDFAIKMQKPIYGIPNDIFSDSSKGINQYISQKKINLISDFKFLSKHFSYDKQFPIPNKPIPNISLSENEQKILTIISAYPSISLSNLAIQSQLSDSDLIGFITLLEINKLIYQDSPNTYKILG
ncbi:DNA-protecting protein DprA [Candidatus Gracilibacteria bacterium]|nr:DNA-protecting protein DprA [Candidatus Gracilibacteria bacterium]